MKARGWRRGHARDSIVSSGLPSIVTHALMIIATCHACHEAAMAGMVAAAVSDGSWYSSP